MDAHSLRWVPVRGSAFQFDGPDVVFPGGTVLGTEPSAGPGAEPVEQPTFGLVLSSYSLADGDVSADFAFSEVSDDSIAEIAVAYDINARHIVDAGIGGDRFSMFCVREFGPDKAEWNNHTVGGVRAGIRRDTTYHVDASFRGNVVTLRIDGVPVATAEVTSPLGRPRQVGIFCRGRHPITIKNFTVEPRKPKAFVVMQFGSQYDDVYNDVIKGVCEKYEASTLRADEVAGPGLIISDIIREISSSQLIIADITPVNANVYFEIGYALALNKPTILLAKKGTPLPFDVAGFRVLFYEDSIGGKSKLEEGLHRHIAAILAP
jgi:hypothetical protein